MLYNRLRMDHRKTAQEPKLDSVRFNFWVDRKLLQTAKDLARGEEGVTLSEYLRTCMRQLVDKYR